MRDVRLGKTDMEVSRIAFGTWGFRRDTSGSSSIAEVDRHLTSLTSSSMSTPTRPRFDTFPIRVADIHAVDDEWRGRGAESLTPPQDNHDYDVRCYLRDPDGRIIEVGQTTGFLEVIGAAE